MTLKDEALTTLVLNKIRGGMKVVGVSCGCKLWV